MCSLHRSSTWFIDRLTLYDMAHQGSEPVGIGNWPSYCGGPRSQLNEPQVPGLKAWSANPTPMRSPTAQPLDSWLCNGKMIWFDAFKVSFKVSAPWPLFGQRLSSRSVSLWKGAGDCLSATSTKHLYRCTGSVWVRSKTETWSLD